MTSPGFSFRRRHRLSGTGDVGDDVSIAEMTPLGFSFLQRPRLSGRGGVGDDVSIAEIEYSWILLPPKAQIVR